MVQFADMHGVRRRRTDVQGILIYNKRLRLLYHKNIVFSRGNEYNIGVKEKGNGVVPMGALTM